MLPFTSEQFFAVFTDYNRAVWPAQWLLWLAGAGALAGSVAGSRRGSRLALLALAGLWLWMAFAYHLAFFAAVNPMARFFAVAFAGQGLLLGWRALVPEPPRLVRSRSVSLSPGWWSIRCSTRCSATASPPPPGSGCPVRPRCSPSGC
jgi:hypothetical protein